MTAPSNATRWVMDLYEHAPCGFHSLDANGIFLHVNDTELNWLGYTLEEMIGKMNFTDLLAADGQHLFREKFPILKQAGLVRDLELDLIRKDGSIMRVLAAATAVFDGDGSYLMSRWVLYDITELKRTQEKLRISEERFASSFECAAIGMALVAPDGRFLRVNASLSEALGYTQEEFVGKSFQEITHREDLDVNLAYLRKMLSGEINSFHTEKRYLHKSGRVVWALLSVSAARDKEGKILHFVAQIQDITTRKRAETKFRHLLESAPDAMIVSDRDGKITLANAQVQRLFGYTQEELLGQPIECLVPQSYRAQHSGHRRRYFQHAKLRPMGSGLRLYGRRKDGVAFPVEVSLGPLETEEGLLVCSVVRDVRDRELAEQELRTSEERFRVALKNSPVVVFNQDRDLRYTWVNNPVFAWAEKGWLGKTDEEILEPESAGRLSAIKRGVLSSGVGVRQEVEVKYEGRTVYYDLTVEPLRNPYGEIVGITCASTDITERKAMEQALRNREEQINAFFDSSPVGMALLSSDLRYVRVNRPLAQINGKSVEEHLGKTIPEVLPTLAPALDPIFRRILASGESFLNLQLSGVLPGSPNDTRYWLASYFPVKQNGTPSAAGGIVVDVTESKRLECQLQQQAALLDLAQDAIFVRDFQARIVYWNRGAQSTYGFRAEEALGHSSHELLQTKFPIPLNEIEEKLAKFGQWQGELKHVTKDGRAIVVASRWSIQKDPQGTPVACLEINRDITERRRLEEQLLQSQKLDAIGRLAGGVAHDFNNILGVILGHCELLSPKVSHQESLQRHVDGINRSAQRAAALTRQLLAFSRKQVLQPRIIQLNEVIQRAVEMLHRLLGENIELKLHLDADLGAVNGDPTQLEQVIINLAVNARDAMPKGGALGISTRNVVLDSGYIQEHEPVVPGSYVMFSVSDTGIGMDQATASRLFEPFFTTKELGKGTGLGLSIIYGIVKQSNGYVWVYSEPGQGTTFKVYLPSVQAASSVVPPVNEARVVPAPRGSETILLVEDEESLREMTQTILEDAGYRVLSASAAPEALKIAALNLASISILLTDVMLRGSVNGYDLAQQFRALKPGAKVLYMSGYSEAMITPANATEALLLIEKPFSSKVLLSKVRETLDSGAT